MPAFESNTPIEVSIVVPFYNEEEGIDGFFARILPILERIGCTYEVVCVNDGSRDRTLDLLLQNRTKHDAIKVVHLARNFGKENALTAGLDHCRGAAIIPIDADLQDPPELIPDLLAKWREGYDVVYAVRESRGRDSWAKRTTALAFYHIYNKITDTSIPANTGDFRLMDRRVVETLFNIPEKNRFNKGLFAWVGFRQACVYYTREDRSAGQTKWNYWKLWNFALDGIFSFSTLPLRVWTYVGLCISTGSFLYGIFIILRTWIFGRDVPGYPSILVSMLFLGGIQLITLGIIGEYLGRVFYEVKRRPLYIVRDLYGLEKRSRER